MCDCNPATGLVCGYHAERIAIARDALIAAAAYERGMAAGRQQAAADIRAVALQRSTAARVIAGVQDPGIEDMEWAARVAEGKTDG